MDQQGLAALDVERHRPGQRAGRGRVGDRELDRLDEADILRLGEDVDLVRHDLLGQATPVEHRHDLVADLEPAAGRVDLGNDAGSLGAGREGERRPALVLAGDHQRRGEAHARRPDSDAHLAGAERHRRHVLQYQVLGAAPAAADHRLHAVQAPSAPTMATEQTLRAGKPPRLWVRPSRTSGRWRAPARPCSCRYIS